MGPQIFLLILIMEFLVTGSISEEFRCSDFNSSCKCLFKSPSSFEFNCPSLTNPEVIITYEPKNAAVSMTCQDNTTIPGFESPYIFIENYDYLWPLPTRDLDSFEITYCPMLIDVKTMLRNMGVSRVKNITVRHATDVDLSAGYLTEDTEVIEALEMSNSKLKNIPAQFFHGMPRLRVLDLNGNILKLNEGQFDDLADLTRLDLSQSYIRELPSGMFKNLNNLLDLDIWSNDITELHPDVFSNLKQLRSLELSSNFLTELPDGIFEHLTELKRINLGYNKLRNITSSVFKNNRNLMSIRLERNELSELPEDLFQDFSDLKIVTLNRCKLTRIPPLLFRNSTNIQRISLESNNITELPDGLFEGLGKLEHLQLQQNKITRISYDTFKGLKSLDELNLGFNLIELELWGDFLKDSTHLKKLYVNNNAIKSIDRFAFSQNLKLVKVNFSNNGIVYDDNDPLGHPFNECSDLEELSLNNNLFTSMPTYYNNNNLRLLEFDNNRITYVDFQTLQLHSRNNAQVSLKNNLINEVGFWAAEVIAKSQSNLDARSNTHVNTIVYLDGNPIICDCRAYDLLRYYNGSLHPGVRTLLDIKSKNLRCAEPEDFSGLAVEDIWPNKVTCPVAECPNNCTCANRPFDKTYIVDCAGRNFSEVPVIRKIDNLTGMEVYLQDNRFKHFPGNNDSVYEGVTVLNLSSNLLMDVAWVPAGVKVMRLDNNNITRLSDGVLKNLSRSISLQGNPWICDCRALNLSKFIRKSNNDDVRCDRIGIKVIQAELCPTHALMILITAIVFATSAAFIAAFSAFYYKYNQEIKVWMYAHNICLWFVREEDLDKDKEYDAFLSFSHVDENFVVDELVSKLESGPYPYKLCIHTRNFIGGEFIATQVADSVQNSRRTIVVLSPSFLDSDWGKMEFRTAHSQALSEKRIRVIVILYGDIDPNSDAIDNELKAYLKTNTYIKWGDPWFWDKLRYSLPHTRNRTEKNKKFENISVNLDKLDLINGNVTPNVTSTPPAHPLLLKGSPLEFKPAGNGTICTPPAEAGLDMVVAETG